MRDLFRRGCGREGHGGIVWLWGGLSFGPMALISVVGLPDRKLRSYLKALATKQEALINKDKRKDVNDVASEIFKKKRGYSNQLILPPLVKSHNNWKT